MSLAGELPREPFIERGDAAASQRIGGAEDNDLLMGIVLG